MLSIAQIDHRFVQSIFCFCGISRSICSTSNGFIDGFQRIEKYLIDYRKSSNCNTVSDENQEEESLDSVGTSGRYEEEEEEEEHHQQNVFNRSSFLRNTKNAAAMALKVLQQDGPGFDARSALDNLEIQVSGLLVREVLIGILKNINQANRERCVKLGYKFFIWSGQKQNYNHTVNTYHLIMQIFAESQEYKAMWRLLDEMTEKGYPVTSRTFNIFICSCGEADGRQPDTLTYNIIMYAKYRLGRLDQFHSLFDEMGRNGFPPDLHTFNILLHIYGRANKPAEAVVHLSMMKEAGIEPNVLHFTNLIDALSRAGNMDAWGQFEKAEEMFSDMFDNGKIPNVYTYNTMIRGLCMAGKFEYACLMLKEMESRGCNPNFLVYKTLVSFLKNAGKVFEANEVIKGMVEKGQYGHLLKRIKKYKRC
ncbi:unnamed protein product [Lactuca virosa]|uniref:Pentatricopeptide repeat-containing protein n=1 Tax=Lactuca virosa TaxID=75947 RepID=A0AAU9P5R6_9ASTR|nr:unnamed protein product [Lactuca virosa]